MPKTLAVIQSSYIPWKGYFDIINRVDEFFLLDDVQYSRGTWRNRNRIKTAQGAQWLTIPIHTTGCFGQLIEDCRVSHSHWRRAHWEAIRQNYARAAYFHEYAPRFRSLYEDSSETQLSRINRAFIDAACGILGVDTPIRWSSEYPRDSSDPNQRLIQLCRAANADRYLSGAAAKDYLDIALFRKAGIEVSFMDYSGYPRYRQLHGSFIHEVSILDLIFNEGPHASRYMKSLDSCHSKSHT